MKIALTGPESSGKTTLALALAQHLQATYVPEYARDFLTDRNGKYSADDLKTIAREQFDSFNSHSNEETIIVDTEVLVVKIWSDVKYGTCDLEILKMLEQQQFDHYFLCKPDIPWEEDQLREHPEQREELFELYRKELNDRQLPYSIVEGSIEQRLLFCLGIIRGL